MFQRSLLVYGNEVKKVQSFEKPNKNGERVRLGIRNKGTNIKLRNKNELGRPFVHFNIFKVHLHRGICTIARSGRSRPCRKGSPHCKSGSFSVRIRILRRNQSVRVTLCITQLVFALNMSSKAKAPVQKVACDGCEKDAEHMCSAAKKTLSICAQFAGVEVL